MRQLIESASLHFQAMTEHSVSASPAQSTEVILKHLNHLLQIVCSIDDTESWVNKIEKSIHRLAVE